MILVSNTENPVELKLYGTSLEQLLKMAYEMAAMTTYGKSLKTSSSSNLIG